VTRSTSPIPRTTPFLTLTHKPPRIKVTFSIADLNALDQDADPYSQDTSMMDEDANDLPTDGQSGGAQSKGTINQGRTKGGNFNIAPEDSLSPADRPELADDESPAHDEDNEPSFPARINITIEKPGVPGAMQVESIAQDGMIVIENVYFFKKGEYADAKTAEQDWERRLMYTGPPYGNLDQDLQVLLEKYLDERGINTALALWVPEYIDFKEQREYLNWLSGELYWIPSRQDDIANIDAEVKSFVDA
jgi:complement component 1 Q subcomponent-binding protein